MTHSQGFLAVKTSRHPRGAIVWLTGMSGAGRSTVSRVLEDVGWFVIDNLPPALIAKVSELVESPGSTIERVALVVGVVSVGIALSLGLEETYFAEHGTHEALTLFRIFNYPPPADPALWGVGEHTDYGLLTILLQDDAGGLEVKSRSTWIPAPPIPGSFVCNIGDLMQMATERRGIYVRTEYLSPTRAILVYEMPLAEVIYDLYDKLKSVTHGYGTMDYDFLGYRPADLVRLDVLVAGKRVDALSTIVHRAFADKRGRKLVKKLRGEIDRHLFEIAIQAAIGSRIIARETIAPMRKNVTAKCYGGDITRKRKLLQKQKEGKKRMKQFGQVEIPQKAFLSVLEAGGDE